MMLTRLKPKSEFNKNVFTLMTGTTIAQAIPIAISPILTRIYTPEDFGVFALFTALVGFISVIASGRYEQAIMIPKYDKYAINIFILGLLLIVITTFITIIITLVIKNNIVSLVNNNLLESWIYFIPVTVFFIALFNLLMNYNNRTKQYKDIAKATIIKSIVLSIVQIVVGLAKNDFTGLILGQFIAQLFANIKLAENIVKDNILLSYISLKKIFVVGKKYSNFPKYNMPHALLGTILASLPIYIFTPFFGSNIVGHYSLAITVVLSPMMIIATSISQVYNQKITQLYNNGGDTYTFTINLLKSLTMKFLIPFILFIVFAPKIFGFIFGSNWTVSGVYIQVLSIYLFLNFLVSIISYIPSIKELQKKALFISIIHFVILVPLLYLFAENYNILITLGIMCVINSLVLIYNLTWMINSLKVKK